MSYSKKLDDIKYKVLNIMCGIDDKLREIEELVQNLDEVWITIEEISKKV